ncbi:MAG: GNAT family N-acetyltransferase [Spirochaetales bacterium]|nr:GNAT family N-acetyltransferase [Spirochaetales bacterium]
MYYKKLTGEKCYLAPIDENDVSLYTAWFNDLEVTRNLLAFSWSLNEKHERETLEKISKDNNYGIHDLGNDALIGGVGLHDLDFLHRRCEIGVFIGDKSYWGKGFGTEALHLLARFAFDYLNIRNIMLRVFEFNERAIKCYQKVGFKIIGKRRRAIEIERKVYDIIYMDLLSEDLS